MNTGWRQPPGRGQRRPLRPGQRHRRRRRRQRSGEWLRLHRRSPLRPRIRSKSSASSPAAPTPTPGRSSGAQISMVTKSGTNNFHGAALLSTTAPPSPSPTTGSTSRLRRARGRAQRSRQAHAEYLRRRRRRPHQEGQVLLLCATTKVSVRQKTEQVTRPCPLPHSTPAGWLTYSTMAADTMLLSPQISRRARCRLPGLQHAAYSDPRSQSQCPCLLLVNDRLPMELARRRRHQ